MDVVEIEGKTLSPEEYNDTQGWVVAHERHKKTKDKRNAVPATNTGGGGLDLTRQSLAVIRDCALRAAKVQPDIAGDDSLRINMRQNTMIMSTPSLANAKEYSNIKEIMINDKSYATAAYVTAPENASKGVIHGIPKYDNQEDIEKALVNQRNPTILHARRMGLTDSVFIVFEGLFVPYFVYYRGAEYRCFLYKKQYETCTTCGRIGHWADVCPQPDNKKCRGFGVLNPTESHQCVPRRSLCGKGHLTGDKKCKERFKTPYLFKKRWWEKEQQQGDEQRGMKILSNTRATQAWREGYLPENSTEENGNATKDRGGGGGGKKHLFQESLLESADVVHRRARVARPYSRTLVELQAARARSTKERCAAKVEQPSRCSSQASLVGIGKWDEKGTGLTGHNATT
ncbi:hypothetical protein HPB51_023422 [Rhipicephalus microplus]|uniref:CCHC-type domain-containing protein n=1 Tax=Rhipicephalus microplus TaxID=6941 RepID=A0A9J6DJR2_RHIMP|nr:hypothetical protein HPB51_023422 [Rhipicephalus microplus]